MNPIGAVGGWGFRHYLAQGPILAMSGMFWLSIVLTIAFVAAIVYAALKAGSYYGAAKKKL